MTDKSRAKAHYAEQLAQAQHTPLPRIELGAHVDGGIFIAEEDCGQVIGMIRNYSHATRIVTACNAYPQLVAALRNMVANAEAVHSFGLKDEVPPLTAVCFSYAQTEARALLAKLGEVQS